MPPVTKSPFLPRGCFAAGQGGGRSPWPAGGGQVGSTSIGSRGEGSSARAAGGGHGPQSQLQLRPGHEHQYAEGQGRPGAAGAPGDGAGAASGRGSDSNDSDGITAETVCIPAGRSRGAAFEMPCLGGGGPDTCSGGVGYTARARQRAGSAGGRDEVRCGIALVAGTWWAGAVATSEPAKLSRPARFSAESAGEDVPAIQQQ